MCASHCTEFIDATTNQFSLPTHQDKSHYYDPVKWSCPPNAIVSNINSALVGDISDGVVVAFRGTIGQFGLEWKDIYSDLKTFEDWLQNFSAKLSPMQGVSGEVHEGFKTAVQSIYNDVISAIHKCSNRTLYITGHSKGGAMAAIFGAMLKAKGDDKALTVKPVTTFAAPRSGNAKFISAYPYELNAFQYIYDLVPYLPPFGPLSGDVISLLKIILPKNSHWLKNLTSAQENLIYSLYQNCWIIDAQCKSIELIDTTSFFGKIHEAIEEFKAFVGDIVRHGKISNPLKNIVNAHLIDFQNPYGYYSVSVE